MAISGDKVAIKNLSEQEKMIYYFIAENGSVSNAQACQLLNLKPSAARNIFRKMIDKSVIYPTGENRNRKYLLLK